MSSILTKQLTENANSNGNLTLLNWKQFSAKPILTMHHYNEALEVEKQQLASMVESSFYPTPAKSNEKPASLDAAEILKLIQENPDLSAKLMQLLKVSA